jgi:hypothetical protein
VAAASVYVTLRCNGDARPLETVSELVAVANERVVNAFRVLNRELELPVPPTQSIDHVPRIVSELGPGQDIEREALQLAEGAVGAGVANGRNPAGVAAAGADRAGALGEAPTRPVAVGCGVLDSSIGSSVANLVPINPTGRRAAWNRCETGTTFRASSGYLSESGDRTGSRADRSDWRYADVDGFRTLTQLRIGLCPVGTRRMVGRGLPMPSTTTCGRTAAPPPATTATGTVTARHG